MAKKTYEVSISLVVFADTPEEAEQIAEIYRLMAENALEDNKFARRWRQRISGHGVVSDAKEIP